jgi:hypothetical protein
MAREAKRAMLSLDRKNLLHQTRGSMMGIDDNEDGGHLRQSSSISSLLYSDMIRAPIPIMIKSYGLGGEIAGSAHAL